MRKSYGHTGSLLHPMNKTAWAISEIGRSGRSWIRTIEIWRQRGLDHARWFPWNKRRHAVGVFSRKK